MSLSEDNIFSIIKSYFDTYGCSEIQKKSYETLIHSTLNRIVNEEPVIEIPQKNDQKYIVRFSDLTVDRPHILEENRNINYLIPTEARLRDLTYDAPISVNISEQLIDKNGKVIDGLTHNKITIGRIPIMLQTSKCNLFNKTPQELIKAGEDKYDNGGYFIIRGKERVLVSQERISYDVIHVFQQKKNSKYDYISEIRSMSEETGHSVLVQAKIYETGRLVYSLPYITQDIPVGIVFKSLGVDLSELQKLIPEKYYKSIYQESYFISSEEEGLDYIGKFAMHVIPKEKRVAYATQMLENELFPHLGIITSKRDRAMFLMLMLDKLIKTVEGEREPDDRDHVSNKRCETAGILIGDIFRSLYKRFVRSLAPHLQKRREIIIAISRNNTQITQGFRHCFATGNWGMQKQSYFRTGVSQVLSRLTYSATISHLRRLVIPIGKEGKNTDIRQVHNSQYGFVCPTETPEGHTSGIVKNFALLTRVSDRIPTSQVLEIIEELKDTIHLSKITFEHFEYTKILVNGVWISSTQNIQSVMSQIKQKRRNKVLHLEISVSYNSQENEISIYSDEGRLLRPLFNIDNGKIVLTDEEYSKHTGNNTHNWDDLVEQNFIEYLDSYEIENKVVAMFEKDIEREHSYCEIHPCTMLGVCGSMIPFPDHTQSPRNTYQASMVKQALGIYSISNNVRADTTVHMMQYPQKPRVYTQTSDFFHMNDLPYGINAIVAVMCYTGFNQEDSILINQSAIDRGLFRTTVYKTVVVEEKKVGNNCFDIISVPKKDIQKNHYNYQKLDERGIIQIGERVEEGDVLVGRVMSHIKKSGENVETDTSVIARKGEDGVVDKVFISKSPSGYLLVKVKMRNLRIPEIGDKFASRHAQKGTCGMVFRQEDMPFSADGIVPDIIMNPHAIPSRMTINWLLECLGGKSGVIKDEVRYATPFTSHSTNAVGNLRDKLRDCGFNQNGNEILYNGFTGEPLKVDIFMGPVYYQRLKHLVKDKIHARDHGNVQSLTRQPLEGRSRNGGLRFGEMERDCIISHGASAFLKERLFDMSDPYAMNLCTKCGEIASSDKTCRKCKHDRLQKTAVPYAFKLLMQELMAIGMKISIMPQKSQML